jgi:hypothetical protein
VRQQVKPNDAPGYDKFVKEPMDLTTIKKRIDDGVS